VHASHRASRRRLRFQFQAALVVLAVAMLAAAVLIAKNLIEPESTGGTGGSGGTGAAAGSHSSSPRPTASQGKGTAAKGSPLSPGWRGNGRAVRLAFGGDVHFEGPLAVRLAANPATALDGDVSRLLGGADLSMTNFESALISGACTDPQPKAFVFHAPPAALTAFKAAHVTLVTEANNHGEDCGRPGLAQSLAIAKAAKYPIVGIGANAAQAFAPWRTTIHGQRIAIIGATEVLDTNLMSSWTATATQAGLASAYQEAELVAAVQAARKDSDTVIVFLHWGTETQECPNSVQGPLAKALIQAGADIVVGSHAHVELGAGYLGSALVDYGLGNFAFYSTSPPGIYSGALHVTVTGRHIDSFSWRPAQISGGIPVPLHGSAAKAAIRRWNGLRGCTGLSATPQSSTATIRTETRPFAGPTISP
jgi:poly-gamma-glutamate capsule biosynthesis protein CapA/YwtB (metallophosphatase superfamily)